MGPNQQDKARYDRYESVLHVLTSAAEFSLDQVKERCGPERPAFVTTVVRGLEKDGILERFGLKTRPSYRWRTPPQTFAPSEWLMNRVFGARIKRAPQGDRPRERLLAHGAAQLRTAELLAILVRSGRPGESALQCGERIAAHFAEELDKLHGAGPGELKTLSPAASETAYCQIMAGIELGRRAAAAAEQRQPAARWQVGNPADAIAFCHQRFGRLALDADQEELHVVTLDTKHRVINTHQVSRGSLNGSNAHPREVFRPAIKDAAAAVLVVHNHPSGDPTPSPEDHAVTKRLEEAGRKIGIQVVDHIVVAKDQSVSIREQRSAAEE